MAGLVPAISIRGARRRTRFLKNNPMQSTFGPSPADSRVCIFDAARSGRANSTRNGTDAAASCERRRHSTRDGKQRRVAIGKSHELKPERQAAVGEHRERDGGNAEHRGRDHEDRIAGGGEAVAHRLAQLARVAPAVGVDRPPRFPGVDIGRQLARAVNGGFRRGNVGVVVARRDGDAGLREASQRILQRASCVREASAQPSVSSKASWRGLAGAGGLAGP
jgi:hypothetical protein